MSAWQLIAAQCAFVTAFILLYFAGNCVLLQICNVTRDPCFCGYCMLLHFSNIFISLTNSSLKFWKKYFCVSDAIMYHPWKLHFFWWWDLNSCSIGLRIGRQTTVWTWRHDFPHFCLLTYDVTQQHQLHTACTPCTVRARKSLPRAVAKDLKPKCVVFYCRIRSRAKFLTATLLVLYSEINHVSC